VISAEAVLRERRTTKVFAWRRRRRFFTQKRRRRICPEEVNQD
jgi:hypothetical protein